MMGIRFQLLTPHLTVGEFKRVGSMSRGERVSVSLTMNYVIG
jgi:hypothetical protein